MRNDRVERLLMPALLLLMLAMIAAGFTYLVVQERANDRAMIVYNGGQAVAEASEIFMMQWALGTGDLPKGLSAFGVYGPDGEAVARWGTAPAVVSAEVVGTSTSMVFSRASVKIIRPFGGPGFTAHGFMGGQAILPSCAASRAQHHKASLGANRGATPRAV